MSASLFLTSLLIIWEKISAHDAFFSFPLFKVDEATCSLVLAAVKQPVGQGTGG